VSYHAGTHVRTITMSTFIVGQLLGFIFGFLACIAFWAGMQWLKPNIRIAPNVAFNPKTGRLGIKVANYGRRKVTNVEIHLATASRPTGKTMTTRTIAALRWSSVLALDCLQNLHKNPWGLPTTFTFVAQNAHEMLADLDASTVDRRIVFTITARDAWSGNASVQRVAFPRTAVVEGWYHAGLSFAVIPSDNAAVEPLLTPEVGISEALT